jgi:hypothetical protein
MSQDSAGTLSFKDRSKALVFFGVIELLLGTCCSLMIPLSVLNLVFQARHPPPAPPLPPASAIIVAAFFYAAVAVFFIAVGIGSIRARRWARTLMMVVSWIWLVSGLVGLAFWTATFPAFQQQLREAGGRAGETLTTVIGWLTAALLVILYVFLPATFAFFYRSPHVKATVERRDKTVPWTDRVPAPVLAAALLTGFTGVVLLVGALAYEVLPLFGVWTGLPAVLGGLALAALYGLASVELYRLRSRGFWMTVGLAIVMSISGAYTFFVLDPVALYEAMGYSREWAERMAPMGIALRSCVLAVGPIWLAFLLWTRRFLTAAQAASARRS